MIDIERSYRLSDPPELREAERRCYRLQCLIHCLESNLERIPPEEFEPLMDKIEAAYEEMDVAIYQRFRLMRQKAQADFENSKKNWPVA